MGCSVGGDSASPRGLKVAGMTSLKFMPKIESSEICGQSDFPAILGSRSFPTIKTYLSSPEAPKNLEVRVRQSPRTLTLSCLRATPQCRRYFFLFLGVILGGRFNPFYRDSCNSEQPVTTTYTTKSHDIYFMFVVLKEPFSDQHQHQNRGVA